LYFIFSLLLSECSNSSALSSASDILSLNPEYC
jgi:hypothetical protein